MFLDRIIAQKRVDLEQRKREISVEEMRRLALAQPQPRNMLAALQSQSTIRLIAEVKHASPSRGVLVPQFDPVGLARMYEANGAAAISVLTEPHFFLGSPEHLAAIKRAVNIPVLCKDFIIDELQVYEARTWGADAILLICAILDDTQLQHLLAVAQQLHMQCLVEVHSAQEAQRAVASGAAIIGVNSRDLVTFEIHPQLIRELRQLIPAERVVVAESGISTAADSRRLARYNVQAMLVGESLVVSNNIPEQMRSLLQGANKNVQVKICGLRTIEHVNVAASAGADLLGFIFHEPSSRYISPEQARMLSDSREQTRVGPDLVGIFVNKEAGFINDIAEQVGLHFVQLHGNESPEYCSEMNRPVIKGLGLKSIDDISKVRKYQEIAWRILLDTPTPKWGGTGEKHNWNLAHTVAKEMPILLAGGLTPENIAEAIFRVCPWGVDVSSGVETNGQKDVEKIRAFIQNVREGGSLSSLEDAYT